MKNRPPYAITSVDNALRLATTLQLEGSLTVSEAAERLEVARSTAHRLLGMLCYRDFAVQDTDRSYRAGPVLASPRSSTPASGQLRSVALSHLQSLTQACGETSHLVVMTGTLVRFLASVECQHALRVGSREGMAFPALSTSAGMAMLAELPRDRIEKLHASALTEQSEQNAYAVPAISTLRQQLALVRKRGFAINEGRTEKGIIAIGVAIASPPDVLGAISIAMPSVRFSRERLSKLAALLQQAKKQIERDLRSLAG